MKFIEIPATIRLIKGGEILQVFETVAPFDILYKDEDNRQGEKIYYRIEVEAEGIFLVTNPIFVIKKHGAGY